ncbi:DUF1254 domain-containing protein [Sorangium sp. So ce1099]|uniref:DUF1254 domain-containing protein n=1 Tax=Sorangium sp. So ce1099 TaxID=3133331 RepID=UPI003F62C3F1
MSLSRAQVQFLSRAAAIYGYPMVANYSLMYNNFVAHGHPFNQFRHATALATPETNVVTPNNDTLYSQAWLDLRAEPYVLSVPAIKDRYYSFQLVDYFTNNIGYIGTNEGELAAASYLIAGPGWEGAVPGVAKTIQSQSRFVYVLGRTQVKGEADLPRVQALQERYRLTPLHRFLERPSPPAAPALTFPRMLLPQQYTPTLPGFFHLVNRCLTAFQAPPRVDERLVRAFAAIGIGPGKTFNLDAFPPDLQQALVQGVASAYYDVIRARAGNGDDDWSIPPRDTRVFGHGWRDYRKRAQAAHRHIYMNSPREAVYPLAYHDAVGGVLTGELSYTMRFEEGGLPPAKAFWSLSMYDQSTMGFVPNPIARYSLGSDSDLAQAEDGSVTLYIQRDAPSTNPADPTLRNWLPAPESEFYLVLRVYMPEDQIWGPDPYEVPPLNPSLPAP